MTRKTVGAAAVLFAGLLLFSTAAGAATGTETFRFIFTADPHEGGVGRVLASGVVTGAGTDRNVGTRENPDGTTTDLDEISLPGGTITIEDTETVGDFDFDPVTCIAHANVSGFYEVVDSTGAYEGTSGSGTFSGRALFVFARTPDGCSETPVRFFADITARGPLSVP